MFKATVRFVMLGFAVIAMSTSALGRQETASRMPIFQVDAAWPKLPNNWVLGVVSAVAVDRRDHVWILHRPRTVQEDLKGRAAPPVLHFDPEGRFVNAWGGDAQGYDWPITEHGIFIDHKDLVWIGGSGIGDDMLLKFTTEGKFVKQFGARGQSKGNADPKNVNRPADVFVHAKTNEVFVADGYGNRRVIVLDADSGAFKRMWAAFGTPPDDAPPAGAAGAAGGRGGAAASPVLDTEGRARRSSAIPFTPSRSRTMAWFTSPIDRTGAFRCFHSTENMCRKGSSIGSVQRQGRRLASDSRRIHSSSSCMCRISEIPMSA